MGSRCLELASPAVPILGRKASLSRRRDRLPKSASRQRSCTACELGDVEVKEDLARIRVPSPLPIRHDEASSFRGQLESRQPPPLRLLPPQLPQGAADPAWSDSRGKEVLRRLQKYQVLERETEPASRSAFRKNQSGSHERTYLRR